MDDKDDDDDDDGIPFITGVAVTDIEVELVVIFSVAADDRCDGSKLSLYKDEKARLSCCV